MKTTRTGRRYDVDRLDTVNEVVNVRVESLLLFKRWPFDEHLIVVWHVSVLLLQHSDDIIQRNGGIRLMGNYQKLIKI